ncbi:MAG: pantetheine-phosphate adenylyltransferase [Lentimicrobiaceae bacterium]|jgi:pantetheine-phosphate adenylyltransferase|nr:pantetheine-phosphate adenylyltransferase [Lentimicrobiaceae bacterium]
MKKIAVFPGSFDPITKGHESIIKRAIPLFDAIIVAIGQNSGKNNYFSLSSRILWIQQIFKDFPQVSVVSYKGLTIDFCHKNKAAYILRGLRTSADFEFERSIGQINKTMMPSVETVFLLTEPQFTALNSSIVRDIHRHGGDITPFVPEGIDIK